MGSNEKPYVGGCAVRQEKSGCACESDVRFCVAYSFALNFRVCSLSCSLSVHCEVRLRSRSWQSPEEDADLEVGKFRWNREGRRAAFCRMTRANGEVYRILHLPIDLKVISLIFLSWACLFSC